MSSSEILAEPQVAQARERRYTGLIALVSVFALCLTAAVLFFAVARKRSPSGQASAYAAVLLPVGPTVSKAASEAAEPATVWAIRGALTEACTCAVPCSCNFGAGPSPHSYCWPFYSYHIREGHYRDVVLNGLHFGSADLAGGRAMFIDERADERQREALRIIMARVIIRVPTEEAEAKAKEIAPRIRYTAVTQDYDEDSNRLSVAGLGEFSADYIMGLDKSQPVVVRNNTTWRIHDAIKARTGSYHVKSGRDVVNTKDTNSNQGQFEYTSETDFGGPAQWNCGSCANERAQGATGDEHACGR